MRNYFFIFLLVIHVTAYSQDDSLEIKIASTLTEIGKAAGEKVAKDIDPNGGKIISSDGRMELVIPAGAIQTVTSISILPVINTLSPGSGNAYHLEPSGINFQKPLQVIFHYSSDEDVAMPELRSIAWQDDKGQWYNLEKTVVDTTTKTVTGNITHFSTWVFFDYFNLAPTMGRVHVKNQLRLQVVCTYPGGLSDNFKAQLMKKMRFASYVNGIRGGNTAVGTVAPVKGSNEDRFTDYTAPASVPDANPVAVSVEVSNINFNGRTFSKLKLISNITVFDAYRITVVGYNKQHTASCTVTSIDSSSCILQLGGKQNKLTDIQNMNIQVNSSGCRCEVTEINKGNNTGPINIVGLAKVDVVPAHPPEKPYASITVYFIRNMGVMPGWHAPPCGHTNDVVTPSMPLPALPFVVPFEAKDEAYTVMKQPGDNGFEIKVKPVAKE